MPEATDEVREEPSTLTPEAREIARLDGLLAEKSARLKVLKRSRGRSRRTISTLVMVSGAFAYVSSRPDGMMFGFPSPIELTPTHTLLALAATFFLLVGGLLYSVKSQQAESILEADIDLLKDKMRITESLYRPPVPDGKESKSGTYFDSLVKINVENLAEYYSLVKVHTNNSFKSSLLAGFVGFMLIVAGVVLSYWGDKTTTPSVIASIAGVLTEFIAGVFFYLYNRTVRQLKEYHDSLLSVQNILLALKLVTDTEDASAKTAMTLQMCKFLLAGVRMDTTTAVTVAAPLKKPVAEAETAKPAPARENGSDGSQVAEA